ncbi:MAG: roadblock/LC7 domain-containing protein [Candidatus Thorarchaeota archaeon]
MERPDYRALTEMLDDMVRNGGYVASILARDDGLLMASSASPTTNRDIVAAMSGYVASSVERLRNELLLGELSEISIRCSEGKFVVRKILVDSGQSFLLAAVMPRHLRYHSRSLGKVATKIRKMMAYRR